MDAIETISASITRDLNKINTVSQNTSNVSSNGFKSLLVNNELNNHLQPLAKVLNLTQGALKQTGRSLDLALQGNGFFAVKQGGEIYLTRNGSFRVGADGYLLTQAGERVQGRNGDIDISGGRIEVMANGIITVEGQERNSFLMINPPAKIRPSDVRGDKIYLNEAKGLSIDEKTQIKQGFLESSNVDSAREMLLLMETSRHVQTMQKSLQAYEQIMNKTVTELGKK
ncbi:flagellar hook basal-body protein [Motilimonas cestriensis]|uniref:Flagellar hook basal-body protein n=1 Tax=Motilimonas cestriensis TaxID=2742685 RepID=A0ABS8WHK2_9GAMM|nr:flagellar hook basal-body protein [Motilimonas cestriensis]MCE2597109.1 flagellar hook basal-body protein [Motilimonas cestriensis]